MIVVQKRKRESGFSVPAGGEILWYGIASIIPSDWEVVTYAFDCFVMGADEGGASDTPAGSNEHFHNNPAASSEAPDHEHGIHGNVGPASGSTGFYPTTNNNYTAPAGHDHAQGNGTSGPGGGHAHPVLPTLSVSALPPYARLYWIRAIRSTAFPVGGIMMWDDVISNTPSGFFICDGEAHNGLTTPDLREDFIYCAAEDANVGQAGGSETHVHGNQNVVAAGGHPHSMSVSVGGAPSTENASGYQGTTVAAGGHGHGLSAVSDADPDHIHTLENTDPASSLPPFLLLYFVMRTE